MSRIKIIVMTLALTACATHPQGPIYEMVPPDPQTAARDEFDCETATRAVSRTFINNRGYYDQGGLSDYYARCLISRGWKPTLVTAHQ